MSVEVQQVGVDALSRYGQIPIAFTVESVFRVDVSQKGLGGLLLREEKVEQPYVKHYDAYRGEGPTRWARRFDMSQWGIFIAVNGNRDLGGAIVAPGAHLPDLDTELAQLFDIRVHPDVRRAGVGSKLLEHTADWCRQRGCKTLKIETQNVNVPACRFYAKHGCKLRAIDRYAYAAYPGIAHEARLLWYLDV